MHQINYENILQAYESNYKKLCPFFLIFGIVLKNENGKVIAFDLEDNYLNMFETEDGRVQIETVEGNINYKSSIVLQEKPEEYNDLATSSDISFDLMRNNRKICGSISITKGISSGDEIKCIEVKLKEKDNKRNKATLNLTSNSFSMELTGSTESLHDSKSISASSMEKNTCKYQWSVGYDALSIQLKNGELIMEKSHDGTTNTPYNLNESHATWYIQQFITSPQWKFKEIFLELQKRFNDNLPGLLDVISEKESLYTEILGYLCENDKFSAILKKVNDTQNYSETMV